MVWNHEVEAERLLLGFRCFWSASKTCVSDTCSRESGRPAVGASSRAKTSVVIASLSEKGVSPIEHRRGDDGCQQLSEALPKMEKLEELTLDLNVNSIGPGAQ